MNGTQRETTKVSKGWKTGKTPIAEGQRIHYNFVKPHMVLDEKSPSDVAGLKSLEGQNRWRALIENSIHEKRDIK